MARELLVVDLGRREYGPAYEQMLRLHELRVAGALPDLLLLVEHDHVVTLGRRGTREQVFDKTLPVFDIERGGEATYHGPGQLVAYPIVSLKDAGWGVRQLVQALADSAIATLGALGIEARRGETKEDIGVWAGPKKVASIGLAVRRDVSLHGIAVNLNTDLSYFGRIQPCGMDASIMTSAAKVLGHAADPAKAAEAFTHAFAQRLGSAPRAATERELVERLQC